MVFAHVNDSATTTRLVSSVSSPRLAHFHRSVKGFQINGNISFFLFFLHLLHLTILFCTSKESLHRTYVQYYYKNICSECKQAKSGNFSNAKNHCVPIPDFHSDFFADYFIDKQMYSGCYQLFLCLFFPMAVEDQSADAKAHHHGDDTDHPALCCCDCCQHIRFLLNLLFLPL